VVSASKLSRPTPQSPPLGPAASMKMTAFRSRPTFQRYVLSPIFKAAISTKLHGAISQKEIIFSFPISNKIIYLFLQSSFPEKNFAVRDNFLWIIQRRVGADLWKYTPSVFNKFVIVLD
jgi:hypothetical protein